MLLPNDPGRIDRPSVLRHVDVETTRLRGVSAQSPAPLSDNINAAENVTMTVASGALRRVDNRRMSDESVRERGQPIRGNPIPRPNAREGAQADATGVAAVYYVMSGLSDLQSALWHTLVALNTPGAQHEWSRDRRHRRVMHEADVIIGEMREELIQLNHRLLRADRPGEGAAWDAPAVKRRRQ
jgi:hypothetical protein